MGVSDTQKPLFCSDCGEQLNASFTFCPRCGQKCIDSHNFSFRHLLVESVGDYFHLDGKFFKSLKPLFFKPGFLTNEYLAGKRTRYIQPFKLFLIISVLYFLIVSLSGTFDNREEFSPRENIRNLKSLPVRKNESKTHINFPTGAPISMDSVALISKRIGVKALVDSLAPGSGWYTKRFLTSMIRISIKGEEYFIEKIVHSISKLIFLLIPIAALLLKLIYIRRKRLYFDHLIFALHFHSFVFACLICYEITSLMGIPYLWVFWLLSMLGYLLFALRAVYQDSRIKTFFKFFLFLLGYLVITLPVFIILTMSVTILF